MNKMIKDYQQETDFVNAGAGTATWCIAAKNNKKYFIKSFLEVTLVDEENAQNLPAPMVEAQRKSCIQFRIRKERLYNKLNEIQNGVFICPIELITYNGHFCAVTDYLEAFNDSDSIYTFSPRRKTILMRTLLLAMRDLANNHIVHSDIKPDNIIITYNQKNLPQLKIIDFDSSFFEDAPPHNVNEYHGDMVYFAPESMVFLQSEGESDIRLTCAVDKFAVGLLLHKMWCGVLPTYDTEECSNAAEALLLDKPITLNNSIPDKLSTIINGFLQEDPDNRMSYDQAYSLLGEYLSELPVDEPQLMPEPVSQHNEAEVEVICRDISGCMLESKVLTLAPGSGLTITPQVIDGYKCLDGKRDVYVDAAGHADPSSITFKYKKSRHKIWYWLAAALIAALLWWPLASYGANTASDNNDWATASIFRTLCPFYDSVYPVNAAIIHYQHGIELYHTQEYSRARREFNHATIFYDSSDYDVLCAAHLNGADQYFDELMEMIGFEDTNDLLCSSDIVFRKFTSGTWSVSSGENTYNDFYIYPDDVEDNAWWLSSLPDNPGDGIWYISNGYVKYSLWGSEDSFNLYKIKIISKDKMTFTHYATFREYTLIRK